MIKPLSKIASVYPLSVEPEEVETNYVGGTNIKELKEYMEIIKNVSNDISKKLGIEGIHPLMIDKEKGEGFRRDTLGTKIKASSEWQKAAKGLVNLLGPKAETEKVLDAVFNPDWNAFQIGFDGEKYNEGTLSMINDSAYGESGPMFFKDKPNKLKVQLGISHSYFDQALLDVGKLIHLDSLSVGGIIETSDDLIPWGIRSPPKFGNTIHLTPVGSAEPLGDNPLFNSFYNELIGEMGLKPNEARIHLVGRAVDFSLQNGEPRSYFTFVAKTDLSYHEIVERWKIAEDHAEHTGLIACSYEPKNLLSFLKAHEFNYELASKAQKQGRALSNTLPENNEKLLPPATASALTYLAWRESWEKDMGRAREVENMFEGNYDLTSYLK